MFRCYPIEDSCTDVSWRKLCFEKRGSYWRAQGDVWKRRGRREDEQTLELPSWWNICRWRSPFQRQHGGMIGASTGSYVYPRICGSFFSELVSCFSLAPRLFPPVFFLVCQLVVAETFPKPLEYPWFFALFQAGSRGCIREFPCTRSFPFCFHRHSWIHWVRYKFNIFTTETGQNLHVTFPCQIYSNSLSNDSSAYKASSFPDKIKYNKRIIHIRRISIF